MDFASDDPEMESHSKPDAGRTLWRAAVTIPIVLLLVGLLRVFHQSLVGPGGWIPGDPGDTALVHYFLEHGYRWLRGLDGPRGFWDAPCFYP
jgi:hypothetical protein